MEVLAQVVEAHKQVEEEVGGGPGPDGVGRPLGRAATSHPSHLNQAPETAFVEIHSFSVDFLS